MTVSRTNSKVQVELDVTPSWWPSFHPERRAAAVVALHRCKVAVTEVRLSGLHLAIVLSAPADDCSPQALETLRRDIATAVEAVGAQQPPTMCACGARAGYEGGEGEARMQIDGRDVCPACFRQGQTGGVKISVHFEGSPDEVAAKIRASVERAKPWFAKGACL